MGVTSPAATGTSRIALVVGSVGAWIGGLAVVVAATLFALELLARAHSGLGAVMSGDDVPFRQASMLTLAAAGIALPITAALAMGAAIAADREIGGPLSPALYWALGLAPSVPSVALGVSAVGAFALWPGLHAWAVAHGALAFAAVLAMLNAPALTSRYRVALQRVPDTWRVAARAVGASPMHVIARVVVPRVGRRLAAATITAAAYMIGETAALAFVWSVLGGGAPVSVSLFSALLRIAASSNAAAELLLLVLAILTLRGIAWLALRPRRTGAA